MKRNSLIYLFICLFVFLIACADENVPRDYPRVRTLAVANITGNGALFSAEIYEPGNVEITEHGFTWDLSNPDVDRDSRVYLGGFTGTGKFSSEVNASLQEGLTYKVSAFIKAGDYTVYGNTVEFASLGSLGPEITGFSPERVIYGDTVTLIGRNFNWVKNFNKVLFNEQEGLICDPVADTAIKVVVPFSTQNPEKTLSVEVAGTRKTYTVKKLMVDLPSADMETQPSGRWGDTAQLALRNLRRGDIVKIYFGPTLVDHLESADGRSAKFMVPWETSSSLNPVKVSVSGGDLFTKDPFNLLPPELDSISPKAGTWSSSLDLFGKFNILQKDASVKVGSYSTAIVFLSRDKITVTIPANLNITPADVIYSYKTLTTGPVAFKLFPPEILSVTPASGPAGTVVNIKSKYVKAGLLSVRLDDTELGYENLSGTPYDDMTIRSKVKGNMNGPAKLSLVVCGQSDTLDQYFTVTNPYVESILPQTAVPGDTITIEARNYIDYQTEFRLTGVSACEMRILSRSGNLFKVFYPDCNTTAGAIFTVTLNNGIQIVIPSDDILRQAVPIITSIEPAETVYGDEVIIRGSNFSKVHTYNHVTLDGVEMTLTASSETELRFKMPFLADGNYNVNVKVGGYIISCPPIRHNSPWNRLPDLVFENTIGYSMKFGEEILVAVSSPTEYYDKIIYRFDPSSGTFSRLNEKKYNNGSIWPGVVVKGNVAYLFARALNPQLYKFDRSTEEMTKVCDYPGGNFGDPIFLDGDSVFYMGGGYAGGSSYSREFWKYNYLSGVWTRLNDLPGNAFLSNEFTISGKCYVVIATKELYEYDPTRDVWIQRATYPGIVCRYKLSVVSDGYAYQGFGVVANNYFHRYDPIGDSWESVAYPQGYFNKYCLSFSLNNKVFMSETGQRFWVYDPARETSK